MIKYKEIKEKTSMHPLGYLIYLIGVWKLEKNSSGYISISTRFWNPLSWVFCIYVFIYCFVKSFIINGLWDLFYYITIITIPNFISDIDNIIGKAILRKKETIWITKFDKSTHIICDGDTKVKGDIVE
jgi:hypothetical protein